MKVSERFASRYFKGSELLGREVSLRISYLDEEVEMGFTGRKVLKDVLHFFGEDQGLVLNKTNATALAVALGDDSDGWAGANVVLYAEETSVGPSVRIRVDR